jgi:ribokinase
MTDGSGDGPDVLCAGHVNWDVTLRVDRLPDRDGEARIDERVQSPGGSAANVATVLGGLDAAPLLLGSVGTDEHAAMVRRELRARGVETRLVECDGETTVKYLVVDADGEVFVLGNEGVNEGFGPGDLPAERLVGTDHLHLTGQSAATAGQLAREAASAGVTVSFDPGRRLTDRDYDEALAHTDVLFCNDREAGTAVSERTVESIPTVVVKHGSGGAEALTDDRTVSHPGFAVDPVDSTGAGDAFAGGFLAARLRDEPLDRALAVGNACGALATREMGARLTVEWRDVEALLDIGPREV